MMNKYIKIIMEPTRNGIGGSFNTKATFKLDNISMIFKNVPVKIDTGCSISTIPLARFKMLKTSFNHLKDQDIRNNIDYLVSYGVETGSDKPPQPETYQEKMQSKALKFKHIVTDFEIAGVPINQEFLHINYDRNGSILIGMDVLKDWDIHMGTIKTGETIFLACPRIQMNNDYLNAREDIFGITTK